MEKFTKGEWVTNIDSHDEPHQDITIDNSVIDICTIYTDDCCTMYESELVANAHLIAAAPEMYHFIKSLQLSVADQMRADDLLAKARGEYEQVK